MKTIKVDIDDQCCFLDNDWNLCFIKNAACPIRVNKDNCDLIKYGKIMVELEEK